MTTPSDPESREPSEGVNLGKGDPAGDAPFDPYRFGRPDHPIPAEYAPPGYTGPVTPPANPYAQPNPWVPGGQQDNPFNNPPGTPYGNYPPAPYQYPGPPPAPYGPPPPAYHAYAQPSASNGKAIAGMVLGIISILCFWLMFFNIFVILGLIFSLIAMGETKAPGSRGRGMAIAGLVCSIVGAIIAIAFTALAFHAASKCGGFSNSDMPGWDQCFRDHLG